MSVESLYDASGSLSRPEIAWSNADFASSHAAFLSFRI
jgi:hypothetical protein